MNTPTTDIYSFITVKRAANRKLESWDNRKKRMTLAFSNKQWYAKKGLMLLLPTSWYIFLVYNKRRLMSSKNIIKNAMILQWITRNKPKKIKIGMNVMLKKLKSLIQRYNFILFLWFFLVTKYIWCRKILLGNYKFYKK